jgi:hypothetical protein
MSAARWLVLLLLVPTLARAQEADEQHTIVAHADNSPLYLAGQINLIEQAHGDFPARYDGPNSFKSTSEHAVSQLLTLYTGVRLRHRWELMIDVESAGGHGLSEALGLAGFTDLDVVRNPTLGPKPYIARAMVRKIVSLSPESTTVTPTPVALAARVPARRLDVRVGRFGLVDFFDVNGVAGDSHLQFTNWTVDNTGAYDYAADTRGFTYGAIVEYDEPRWSVRAAEALMPTVANGLHLDSNIARARGENVEVEFRSIPALTLRILGYTNHANMGSYTEAIAAFRRGEQATPDIVAHRQQGRVKYGTASNVEYDLGESVRLFARTGWNSGDTESFAYTEVNNTGAIGGDVTGSRWHRDDDRFGIAAVSNGLSGPHREYLRLGGLGFVLGDGNLRYGRETILETYYTARLWRGLYASIGGSYIVNPGYNRDRGPVFVQMARVHVDF